MELESRRGLLVGSGWVSLVIGVIIIAAIVGVVFSITGLKVIILFYVEFLFSVFGSQNQLQIGCFQF